MKVVKLEISSEKYPKKLLNLKNPPKILYCIGNIDLLYKPSIAIVGSRKVSDYGIKNCEYFAKELTLRNILIVSGMAIGIDSIAHLEAVKLGAPTIAVLGTGFKNIYPKENISLMHSILEKNGLVLTECEPDVDFNSKNFPKRNRIISGLALGVLVIEASYRSGTSITVNFAKKQGKKIFALPGRLDLKNGIGVNRFIKEGAQITTCVEDIINSFEEFKNCILPKDKMILPKDKKINEEILSVLEEEKSLEELMWITKKSRKELLKILMELECTNLIKKEQGYRRI